MRKKCLILRNEQGFSTLLQGMILAVLVGLLALSSATLIQDIVKTRVTQDTDADMAQLQNDIYAILANRNLCASVFLGYTFSALTANSVASPPSSTQNLSVANPLIFAGSTAYSSRFTIVSIELRFDSNVGTKGKGRVVAKLSRNAGLGARELEKSVALNFDLSGTFATPGNDITACQAVREEDDVVCAEMGGKWISDGLSTTQKGFCDLCGTVSSVRQPPNDPAGVCVFPSPPVTATPPVVWQVCSPGGPGGVDCTLFQGQPCSPINSSMNCTFSSGYTAINTQLGCQTCPPPGTPPPACMITVGQAWSSGGSTCTSDSSIALVEGASATVQDTLGATTGNAQFTCTAGSLVGPISPVCNSGSPPPTMDCNPAVDYAGSHCDTPFMSNGTSGATASCTSGYTGSCTVSCSAGTPSVETNTCTPPATPLPSPTSCPNSSIGECIVTGLGTWTTIGMNNNDYAGFTNLAACVSTLPGSRSSNNFHCWGPPSYPGCYYAQRNLGVGAECY